ncbi:MAG: replication factor C small subunit [Candidatus Thorarchaeota archaeon]
MRSKLVNIEIPWVEKYRPKSFKEIVSQNVAINSLKDFVKNGNMPHMIFTGPAGTGKTSTALIIAKAIINKEDYYANVLELNASDTVRMDYVRNVIKDFVNQSIIIGKNQIKFIILDEADNIPSQVQQALRRIIEKSSENVKFILLCNYINRIIDPIVSRCAVFRFVKLNKDKIIERLKYIVTQENLTIPRNLEDTLYHALYFISEGDLRKAINTLQMAVALELLDNLNIDEILKISGYLDKATLEKLIKQLKSKNFMASVEILNSIENFESKNLIRQIIENISELDINLYNLSKINSYFGEIDYRISQGADEKIQIISLLAEIIRRSK